MDLGLFKRRRVVFWVWVTAPLIAAGVIHYSVFWYCQRTAAMCQKRAAMAAVLPDMSDALRSAETSLARFPAIGATATDVRSALTTRIYELAGRYGVQVNNMRIKSLQAVGPMQRLAVTIEGEGRLLAIIKIVNDLQTPESLMSLVRGSLRAGVFFPIPVYHCELGFEIGFFPSMQKGEVQP